MKNVINKVLLFAYLLFVLFVPMWVLAMAVSRNIVAFSQTGFMNAGRLAYYFISVPAYFVYAKMIIKSYFPKDNKDALKLFLPLLFTLFLYFWAKYDVFFDLLVLDSLPLYLGLNFLFFLGLLKLLIIEEFSLLRLFVGVLILSFLFYGAFCLFVVGYQLNVKFALSEIDRKMALLKYFASILLVSYFHYPLVKKLSEAGNF